MSVAVNRLAKLLAASTEGPIVLYGVVLTFSAATTTAAQAIGVDFEGAGNATPCIALSSYTPTVGDNVVAIGQGPDFLVLGTIN